MFKMTDFIKTNYSANAMCRISMENRVEEESISLIEIFKQIVERAEQGSTFLTTKEKLTSWQIYNLKTLGYEVKEVFGAAIGSTENGYLIRWEDAL